MKASQSFIDDFEYLSKIYKWNAEDEEEMKNWIRSDRENTAPYITSLAAQWRQAEGLA